MTQPTWIIDLMAQYGLFLSPLNNGDWMAGPASHIYDINIMEDHYADPYLRVGKTPHEAIAAAVELRQAMMAAIESRQE